MKSVLNSLSIPAEAKLRKNDLVEELRVSTGAKTLESCLYKFDRQMAEENKISYAWFITDAHGTQLARCRTQRQHAGHEFRLAVVFLRRRERSARRPGGRPQASTCRRRNSRRPTTAPPTSRASGS